MKELTWKELYKLALRNYENGGDGIVECWDESTFNEYVAEFGQSPKKLRCKCSKLIKKFGMTCADTQTSKRKGESQEFPNFYF